MPWGLSRFQNTGDLHFLTFSCYRRQPNLNAPSVRNRFESSLEQTRQSYKFAILGYVVMPEHVHLLLTEPAGAPLSKAIQALKQSVSRHLKTSEPFWQTRYYDFNVRTEPKRIEKLRYIHRNPVVRGLVAVPEEWAWSSFRQYALGIEGKVTVTIPWRTDPKQILSKSTNPGAPF